MFSVTLLLFKTFVVQANHAVDEGAAFIQFSDMLQAKHSDFCEPELLADVREHRACEHVIANGVDSNPQNALRRFRIIDYGPEAPVPENVPSSEQPNILRVRRLKFGFVFDPMKILPQQNGELCLALES